MAVAQVEEQQVREIPVDKIEAHKLNPRKDVGEIDGLATSIQEGGLVQPITVVRDNGGWALVDGRRRLAAVKKLGLTTISAIERFMSEEEIATAALVANMQRKDLDALEEAVGYRNWLSTTKKSQADLARAIGKDPSTISNALRILDAPAPIRDALREKRITPAHARVALELKDPAAATSLSLKPGVTVDQLQDAVTRQNDEYDTKGAGAAEVLRKALEGAKAKYPNATITWQAGQYDVVSMAAALGKAPARIVGQIGEGSWNPKVPIEKHDKACTCRAYELSARRAWSGQAKIVTELKRVCIDAKGFAAAKPKERKETARAQGKIAKARKPKAPTPEQLAKKATADRQRTERAVTKELVAPKPHSPKGAPIFVTLRKGTIPIDVARAVVFLELVAEGYFGAGIPHVLAETIAWGRVAKMPAKKVSALAAAAIAKHLEDELINTRHWSPKGEDSEAASRLVAAHFGVKVAEPKKAKGAKR